jgi:NADPH2:quinone reductase
MTGRALRKASMANVTVVGVILAYLDLPVEFRKLLGLNPFPPAVGERVHASLLELVAAGKVRPTVGRVVGFDEVAGALDDHAARRTTGRTVLRVKE